MNTDCLDIPTQPPLPPPPPAPAVHCNSDTPLQETYLAKHMQKHADRSDKRPPIIAGPTGMSQDLHWPKMDPSLYQGYERLDPYGQGLMDPTRFHQQFAEDLRHQGPYGMGGGGWGDPCKASSAFSPLNSGVLPTSTGFNMSGTTRGYPFYDPISFQRQAASQVGQHRRTLDCNGDISLSGWFRVLQDGGVQSDLLVTNKELRSRQRRTYNIVIQPASVAWLPVLVAAQSTSHLATSTNRAQPS